MNNKASLEKWVETLTQENIEVPIETIRNYFYKHKGDYDALTEIYKKYLSKFAKKIENYTYVDKYLERKKEWERGGFYTLRSKRMLHMYSWRRTEENLYLKIADKQEEVEKFILGDLELQDDGRFIYIKSSTSDAFIEFMDLINEFILNYMKEIEFRKNLNWKTTKQREDNLNKIIDLINEIQYIQDEDNKEIKHISMKDFKDLKKELIGGSKTLEMEFYKSPNSLSAFIDTIINIIQSDSEFINSFIEFEKKLQNENGHLK